MEKKDRNLCTIYIVRHGETDWNAKNLVQGHTNIPLNKKGINQAKQLAKTLRNIRFAAVFSSDLLRAKRTAEIIALEKKLAITTTKILRERCYGQLEGMYVPDDFHFWQKVLAKGISALTKKEKKEYLKNLKHKKGLNLETDEELMKRFIPFLREIAVAYQGKNVLIVTHGSILRIFLVRVGYYKDIKESLEYRIKNTGYVVIESDGVDFFVKETYQIEKRGQN